MRQLIFICLIWPLISTGQCYNRYIQEVFPIINTVVDIPYGESINYAGDTLVLQLDFYEPAGDSLAERPLFILMHGPNFVEGTKEDLATVAMAQRLAKRGFVVATIDYRLAYSMQTLLDKNAVFRASLQAAQDAKAAVRFFRKSMTLANLYRIDTNMIWLGGIGAGAMAAQSAAFLNDSSELSNPWRLIAQEEGGIEGNSGQPNFSSHVKGVLSIGGAILDTAWLRDNPDIALINIHGTADDYIPFASDSLFAYTHNFVCNGQHELCYKRLNEATFVQTHNSHANDSDFSVFAANQNGDIPAQFAAGVRALGIKLYYTSSFFCGGGTNLYAYHGDPILGCIPFSTIGAQISTFLQNNPNEFLFITVEGSASNAEIAAGFQSAGLTGYLYQHNLGEQWPTIGQLIQSGKRLIVMTSNGGPSLPGYHPMWSFMQDTEYNFQSTNDFNCNYLRGNQQADLFLLNHFLTIASPQPLTAASTNDWSLLLNRARQCGASRGLHPNFLYIDFFNSGNVFRAADSLNRIGADFPSVMGSALVQQQMLQLGYLSELYPLNGVGYAPLVGAWGDSAVAFTTDFLVRHFPCELSCAPPVTAIIGSDSIATNTTNTYTITANQGASYTWGNMDSVFVNTSSISFQTALTAGVLNLYLVETSQYGCQYDTIRFPITVFNNTSVQTLENTSQIKIYPNPSHQNIQIDWQDLFEGAYQLYLYNGLGQLIFKEEKNTTTSTIDISHLPQGNYWIKIVSDKAEFSTKITKR